MPPAKAGKAGEKSNVRVVARCRPVNQKEVKEGGHTVVKFFPDKLGAIELTVDDMPQTFQFDRMFAPESTQQEVFENSVLPLITDVLEGYNATVFAYGQTGTGKTHTMEGDISKPGEEGIIPRSVEALFAGVEEADEHVEFTFKVSYVEIYMEKIRDLLDPNRLKNNLTVREDKTNGIYIAGVTEEYVTSFDELLHCMTNGATNRATAATGMNEGSSRSHSVFTITINQKDLSNATAKSGKLVLVDLAGSEMVRKTGASGQQLEEAKTINKSLSALGQVINALTDEKQTHIPYRDSKLTRVLQDSLGGNSKTVLIVAISPSSYNANETLSTIRFGLRAKAIENKVTVNASRSVEELEALLTRAERAIDVQAAHIVTLTAKLEGHTDASFESISEGGKGDPGSSAAMASPIASSATSEQVALMEQLQVDIATLTQDLDDERQDSVRKDGELDEMGDLLKEKERLLFEAGDLLQEARRHYESQRERCETVLREKAELSSQLERITTAMSEEVEHMRFNMKETQVSLDTLRAENKGLLAEIAEVSGDTVLTRERAVAPIAGREVPPPRRQTIVAGPIKSTAEREVVLADSISAFKNICNEHNLAAAVGAALLKHVKAHYQEQENDVVAYENKAISLERAQAETNKRIRELEIQRERLETDLASRTESAVKTKLELEMFMTNMHVGAPGDAARSTGEQAALAVMQEKERTHSASLQQRLEQLVSVHRQLLRKFASVELDSGELRKKLGLRDERILQLEGNVRGNNSNMRAQSERHVAELTNLREQIRLMKEEHIQRTDQQQHYLDLQLLASRESTGARRTLRGGQGVTPAAEGSPGVGSGGGGSFSRPKSIQGGRASKIVSVGGGGGGSVHGGGGDRSSSSFHSMMARLGVSR